eukprot:CCRYP_016206-RC/>CCRYP_016206-RC protein AED:0.23 eAED:0.27 QI:0/0/0/1/0/0/2/0/822
MRAILLLLLSLASCHASRSVGPAAVDDERSLTKLSTVAISTFLLELTIQRRPDRKLRRLSSSSSADDLLQSTAERHLAKIYGELLAQPSQVLLTVVTTDAAAAESDGFYVRSSFVGGVVSFPVSADIVDGGDSSQGGVPTRAQISDATMSAFAIPGYGEDFLNDLLEAQNPELDGLLLVGAKEVSDGDAIAGNNGDSQGLDKIYDPPVDTSSNPDAANGNTDSNSNSNSFSISSNIWAIAAVAALGAMFLTILMCTTVLWCDWRKRKARKERMREHKEFIKQQQQQQNNASSNDDYFHDNLRVIPTLPSEETMDGVTPSPSTQDSDTSLYNNVEKNNNSLNTNRTSIIQNIRKKSVSKSKAAQNHLQLSSSMDDEDSSSPSKTFQEPAPSVTYSVGEDTTTMLYPAIHRGRQNSRDLSEFDGYSMDGMSAMDGHAFESQSNASSNNNNNSNKQHPLLVQRNIMYSGEVPRDFDSVWDDESKMTMSIVEGQGITLDDDSIMGSSILNDTTMDKDDKPILDLKSGLNRLDEDNAVSKNFLNEFDSESESESSSNRGAFTLELLKGNTKTKKKSLAPDDDDSILGDIGGRSELVDSTSAMEEVEEEEEVGESNEKVPSSEESVDSSPSWAGRIKSALLRSTSKTTVEHLNTAIEEDGIESTTNSIFRPAALATSQGASTSPIETTASEESRERSTATNAILGNQASPSSVKDKFVSSLGLTLSSSFSKATDDEGSVGSSRSARSSSSRRSNASLASRTSTSGASTARSKSREPKALGLTNSVDEEVDEDPAEMIENINSMLSECRVILDTDVEGPVNLLSAGADI